jgi:hypothetical protein
MTSRSKPVLLKCGHASNSVRTASGGGDHAPIPSCVICDCIDPEPKEITLEGRTAICCNERSKVPSTLDLAFFKYRGEGSRQATETCANCGYYCTAHELKQKNPPIRINKNICDNFQPRGALEFDRYYCGCRGWD